MLSRLVLMLLVLAGPAAPIAAGVENDVRVLVETGQILPLESILNRVTSQVRGDYVGAEWDPGTRTYRLRFLVNGNVINVDVDARTGQRLRRSNY